MNKLSALLLSMLLAVVVRAEDKPKAVASPAAKPATHKPDEVVARAGTAEIKWKELDQAVAAVTKQYSARGREFPADQLDRLQYDVVNEMVTRELILQEGRGHEPADLDAKVKAQMDQVKQQAGGEEALDKALGEMGVTRDDYTKRIRESLVIQETLRQVVEAKVKITPDACKKFYDENRSKFSMPEQVRARHILILVPEGATEEVKAQKLAQIKAALSLVKGGDKFEDVARKFSEDPGSAAQGGDLSYFTHDRMVKEFADAAFAMKTNEVSNIVTTQFGYHIIKVTDHKPAGERAYADVQGDIERYLQNQQGQEVAQQHLKELRDKSKVEIRLPVPTPITALPPAAPKP